LKLEESILFDSGILKTNESFTTVTPKNFKLFVEASSSTNAERYNKLNLLFGIKDLEHIGEVEIQFDRLPSILDTGELQVSFNLKINDKLNYYKTNIKVPEKSEILKIESNKIIARLGGATTQSIVSSNSIAINRNRKDISKGIIEKILSDLNTVQTTSEQYKNSLINLLTKIQ
jgi:hypothetical protein